MGPSHFRKLNEISVLNLSYYHAITSSNYFQLKYNTDFCDYKYAIRQYSLSIPLIAVIHLVLFLGYFSLSLFLWVLLGFKFWRGRVQILKGGGANSEPHGCNIWSRGVQYFTWGMKWYSQSVSLQIMRWQSFRFCNIRQGCSCRNLRHKNSGWARTDRTMTESCRICRP